ncbi:uncharacterized protein, partial [Zea mays]|uniref:uncharacterized protein n=1 Tax=Zea mays TaxID=4577 RepID=UPI0004DEB080
VFNRLPCAIDRAWMAAVCQAWLTAVARAMALKFQLPSLLLLPADVTGVYCYLSGCRKHNMLPGPCYFGSYDGGWFFLAYGQTCGHRLLNIRTGDSRALPDVLFGLAAHKIHRMVVLATTLSFPPEDLRLRCIVAGIVTYQPDIDASRRRHFAFWRPGAKVVVCDVLPAVPVGSGWEQEDVVYYRDSFHFLTQGGHILMCGPIYGPYGDGGILVVLSALSCFQEGRCSCSDEQFVRARYLVVSRGELLMVVRLAAHHHVPTSSFKVFRMIIIEPDDNGEDADEYTRTWIELGELCGRMLFVGRGCSCSWPSASSQHSWTGSVKDEGYVNTREQNITDAIDLFLHLTTGIASA